MALIKALSGLVREAAATLTAALMAVLLPLLHLWPWLVAATVFFGFLSSSQGQAIAADMVGTDWASGGALILATTFFCTLAASLFTSLVVASFEAQPAATPVAAPAATEPALSPAEQSVRAEPRWASATKGRFEAMRQALKRGRTVGALHLAWGFALGAALPVAAMSFFGITGRGVWFIFLLVAAAFVVVFTLLRGAWTSASAWSERIGVLRRYRFLLGATIMVVAVTPLYSAAQALVRDPLSATPMGPAFVAMLGLSSLASLLGACFVALPYCLPRPRWGVLAMCALVAFNVWQLPLVDAPNPLLAEMTQKARANPQCRETSQREAFRGARRTVIDRAQAVRAMSRDQKGPSLLFVSAEGGGIRAAYWSGLSLWELSQEVPDFRARVAQLTGVSGGSLGIATWLAAVDATDSPAEQRQLIENFLSTDFLSPAVAGLLFLDAPRLIFGGMWPKARRDDIFSAALVSRWGQLVKAEPNFFLRPVVNLCLFRQKDPPLIFFDAADALGGLHVGGSNLRDFFQGPRRSLSNAITQIERQLRSTGVGQRRTDSVVEAVVNSARFPLLAPAADIAVGLDSVEAAMRLRPKPRPGESIVQGPQPPASVDSAPSQWARLGVLVDGGYFDNSGLARVRQTLASIDRADAGIQVNDVAAYVVHIGNDPGAACNSPGDWKAWASRQVQELVERTGFTPMCRYDIEDLARMLEPRPLGWLSSPFEALLAVRAEHSYQEKLYLRDALAFRAGAGGVFEVSLAEQLTRVRCREFADDEVAANCVFRAGFPSRPVANSYCPNLSQQPTLPLGWTLSQHDRNWLGCLSGHAARTANARMTGMDAENYRQAQARERKAQGSRPQLPIAASTAASAPGNSQ